MPRGYGARAQLALAYESTYGTAPTSGFRRLSFARNTLGEEQEMLDNELLGYGRDPLAPSRDMISVDGDVVVPVDVDGIGFWMKGLLGQPTTTGTTPRTHTFVSGVAALPSLAIEKQMPDVPAFEMITGLRVNTMQITMQQRGRQQATFGLIGRGLNRAASTAAGTVADLANLTRFNGAIGGILRDGSPLANIDSVDMTYSNNMERVETIRSDGRLEDVDPTIASLTGTINARFENTTLLDQAISGATCTLQLQWIISANQQFGLTLHAVHLGRARTPVEGPGGIRVAIPFQAALAASPPRMLTAVLINAVASY